MQNQHHNQLQHSRIIPYRIETIESDDRGHHGSGAHNRFHGNGNHVTSGDYDRQEAQFISRTNQLSFNQNGTGLAPFSRSSSEVHSVTYEVDHLVTFDVATRTGIISHAEAVRRLRAMETSTGIWTRRVLLSIDQKELVVLDKASGKELDAYSINRVADPISYFTPATNAVPDVFNNLLIFVVDREAWSKLPSTMNIFQCIGVSGQVIVEELKAACEGKSTRSSTEGQRDSQAFPEAVNNISKDHYSHIHKTPAKKMTDEEKARLLNRCFDDIEDFISRTQAAARQLPPQQQPSSGNAQSRTSDGAVVPSKPEFVDILQKFKLALNLIVELQDWMREPSSTDLLGSVFQALKFVVNICKDSNGQPRFVENVLSPLLNDATCRFLEKNLRPEDLQLWKSLGLTWTVPRESWTGKMSSDFVPRFRNISNKPPKNNAQPTTSAEGGDLQHQQQQQH